MSEGSKNPGEGQNQVNVDELQSKLDAMMAELESVKGSKERLLEESKNYKQKYQAYKSKEDETNAAKLQMEEERLKKEGQFQVLVDQKENRIKELEQSLADKDGKIDGYTTAFTNMKKAEALEGAIGGKIKRKEYWSHVDFNDIAINPDTGEIDSHSVKSVADNFSKDFRELIDFGAPGNLPNGSPSAGSTALTHDQWLKLKTPEEKRKRMKDVVL